MLDALFVLFQRLLPARALGRLVHRLSRSERPWLKSLLIGGFCRLFRIDLDELDRAPADFPSLNAFFTRPLRAGARPLDPDPASVVSPADGTLEQLAREGEPLAPVAKGFQFTAAALLAAEGDEASAYAGGSLATIYLAPHNYHRFHMPLDARICRVVLVPGRRWAVNRRTARSVRGLFAENERVVCHCETPGGPLAVVLVGALNVASISLAFAGEVLPDDGPLPRRIDYPADEAGLRLARGALLGQFNLGSTVILVTGPGLLEWDRGLVPGQPLRMGQRIGRLAGA